MRPTSQQYRLESCAQKRSSDGKEQGVENVHSAGYVIAIKQNHQTVSNNSQTAKRRQLLRTATCQFQFHPPSYPPISTAEGWAAAASSRSLPSTRQVVLPLQLLAPSTPSLFFLWCCLLNDPSIYGELTRLRIGKEGAQRAIAIQSTANDGRVRWAGWVNASV